MSPVGTNTFLRHGHAGTVLLLRSNRRMETSLLHPLHTHSLLKCLGLHKANLGKSLFLPGGQVAPTVVLIDLHCLYFVCMNNSNNSTNKGNYCFYRFLRRGSREKCQALLLGTNGKMGVAHGYTRGGSGWALGNISVPWVWSDTGIGFLEGWLISHVYSVQETFGQWTHECASTFGYLWSGQQLGSSSWSL